MGWFALMVEEDPDRPNLGYRLHRRFWGQSLATEGSSALIEHAFVALGAGAVEVDTMFVNWASRRVMEKCGLRLARTFHLEFDDPLPGTEHGEVLHEITRREWEASAG